MKTKSYKILFLLSMFLAITGLVKNEGQSFVLIILCIGCFYIRSWKKLLFFAGSFLCIGTWYVFKYIYHLPETSFINTTILFTRIPTVLMYASKEFLNFGRWNFLWIVFFFSFFITMKNKGVKLLSLIFFLQLTVYLFIYLTTLLYVFLLW